MLDYISGGRIISGFVRGTAVETLQGGIAPPQNRDRFEEAHDLIVKCWTGAGATELKVIRDENGVALGSFGGWAGVIDQAWRQGAIQPAHQVSDGDSAIASGIPMVYGRPAPHQLCHCRLLREYRGNIGETVGRKSAATAGVVQLGGG